LEATLITSNMALVEQYFQLTQKHRAETGAKTVVLMQVGGFFEIYGKLSDEEEKLSSIHSVSRLCAFRTGKKTKEDPDVRMAGMPLASLDKYVELLLHAGWTIAVYTQSEISGRTDRSLAHVYTPGTFFSPNSGVSNHLLVIWVEYRPASIARPTDCLFYGLACLDNMAGSVVLDESTCSPLRNDTSDYEWVQEVCVAYNPREVRIVSGNEKTEHFAVAIEGIATSLLPQCCVRRHEFSTEHVIKAQKQTFQDEVVRQCYGATQTPESLTLLNYPVATSAFTLLLAEANSSDPSLTRRLARPIIATAVPRLLMANHSLRQLNIINTGAGAPNARYSSVLRAICEGCFSNMGRRLVTRRIRSPLVDAVAIDNRLRQVDMFFNNVGLLDSVRSAVRCIPDGETEFRTVAHRTAKPDMLACHLRDFLEKSMKAANLISENKQEAEDGRFVELSSKAISSGTLLLEQTNKRFHDSALDTLLLPEKPEERGFAARWLNASESSPEYSKKWNYFLDCLNKVIELRDALSAGLQEATVSKSSSRSTKTSTTNVVHLEDKNGVYIKTTQTRAKQLQSWANKRKTSANNELHECLREGIKVVAMTGSNVRLENKIICELLRDLDSAKADLIESVEGEYSLILDWYSDHEGEMRNVIDFISTVDVATTGAKMAIANRYCRPDIVREGDGSWFEAQGLRHMLAERIDHSEAFVPNDLNYGARDGEQDMKSGLLLFGTNASGKSTLIKSLGIAVVLAQTGFYVPASLFRLRPYSSIYTRILGNDDLFRGLSTFAVEMTEFNAILRNAHAKTLVLGDELCSGTETVSAISIFASGLVQLAKTGSTHLFATHFHEVVRLPCVQGLERLETKHLEVRYDAEADVLVYDRKLADGAGDSIYGLEVCKSLKMPQEFLDRAYEVRAVLLPEGRSVLGAKTSRYSSKKVRGECEVCGEGAAAHVHHLVHQADADDNRMVEHMRVDAAANLINVCESCHAKFHEDGADAVRYRKAKTIDGDMVLVPV
jgi:DNA mismatch repair protein MutS